MCGTCGPVGIGLVVFQKYWGVQPCARSAATRWEGPRAPVGGEYEKNARHRESSHADAPVTMTQQRRKTPLAVRRWAHPCTVKQHILRASSQHDAAMPPQGDETEHMPLGAAQKTPKTK